MAGLMGPVPQSVLRKVCCGSGVFAATPIVVTGLVPVIHAVCGAHRVAGDRVDAHGSKSVG
jgi:hypothetical protein